MSAQKALQGSETETRSCWEEGKRKALPRHMRPLIFLLQKAETELKIELVDRPDVALSEVTLSVYK